MYVSVRVRILVYMKALVSMSHSNEQVFRGLRNRMHASSTHGVPELGVVVDWNQFFKTAAFERTPTVEGIKLRFKTMGNCIVR
jgi:hypothetical protein